MSKLLRTRRAHKVQLEIIHWANKERVIELEKITSKRQFLILFEKGQMRGRKG